VHGHSREKKDERRGDGGIENRTKRSYLRQAPGGPDVRVKKQPNPQNEGGFAKRHMRKEASSNYRQKRNEYTGMSER